MVDAIFLRAQEGLRCRLIASNCAVQPCVIVSLLNQYMKILKILRRSYVPGPREVAGETVKHHICRIAEQRKLRSLHLGRQSLKHSLSVAQNIDCRIGIGCRSLLLWSRGRFQDFNLCSMNPSHGKWGKKRRTIRWYSPPAHDRVAPSWQIEFPDFAQQQQSGSKQWRPSHSKAQSPPATNTLRNVEYKGDK